MKVNELKKNPKNPRNATSAKLAQLKKSLLELGDISGIVFNRKSNQLVGGHQRIDVLGPDSVIEITKKYPKPTRTGTVAEGYVIVKGERFTYREVSWDPHREIAANIAANNNAGEWDLPQLTELMQELNSFDAGEFDLELTMFDDEKIKEFLDPEETTVSEHTRSIKDKKPDRPPKARHGQVYLLGSTRLLCSRDELYFCDEIIARWERYSGESAVIAEAALPKRKTQ